MIPLNPAEAICRSRFKYPDSVEIRCNLNETDSPSKKYENETARSSIAISSAKLLGKSKKMTISHNEEIYTLRITANNKLILTK